MVDVSFDVAGIGNAIVDMIAQADDAFLLRQGLAKGSMTLVDEDRSKALYAAMGPTTMTSGGSAANTIVGLASLGARTAFIGKVRNDHVGDAFAHDIRSIGVTFTTPPATGGAATATCMIVVTPDGERTMNTYLGACQTLGPDDVDPEIIRAARYTYLEGYLWDPPEAKKAFVKAAEIAHAAGRKVALTLSDSFCVDRYRDEFIQLLRTGAVDVVFANQHEIRSMYQTADLDTAVASFRNEGVLGVVTMSGEGSLVVTREQTHKVPAHPIDRLVDTTGAGDMFAAGFLFGLTRDLDLPDCARLGGLAAAEVIQHVGARPQISLRDMANDSGFSF